MHVLYTVMLNVVRVSIVIVYKTVSRRAKLYSCSRYRATKGILDTSLTLIAIKFLLVRKLVAVCYIIYSCI